MRSLSNAASTLARSRYLRDHRLHGPLVDRLRVRRIELLVLGVLVIAQNKNDLCVSPGCSTSRTWCDADGRPSVRHGVGRLAALHRRRPVPAAPRAQKSLALCVETRQRGRAGEPGEVIAALAVFRLVIDHFVFDLHLADAEIPLEIGGVVLRIHLKTTAAINNDQRSPVPATVDALMGPFAFAARLHSPIGEGHRASAKPSTGCIRRYEPRLDPLPSTVWRRPKEIAEEDLYYSFGRTEPLQPGGPALRLLRSENGLLA